MTSTPTLPLTGHVSGRASSLPAPPPKAPAVPQPQPQPPEPARVAVVIPADGSADPDTVTPLPDDATAEQVAAAVARFRRAADLAAQRAERDQAEGEQILEAARAEAARITGEAEAAVQPLARSAAIAGQAAAALGERARLLHRAAEAAVTAGQAEATVRALEDEREQLADRGTELRTARAEYAAQLRALEADHAAAREAGNLDGMTAARNRADSLRDLGAALEAQQETVRARLAEIGTGEETFASHGHLKALPPLAEARRQAAMRRHAVAEALHAAYPDSPQAVAAAERHRRAERDRYDAERAAADRAAAERARRDQQGARLSAGA